MNGSFFIYATLFFLWAAHFLVDLMIGIWPVYKTLANLDLAWAGIISGLSALVGEGLQIIFGPLCDRGYRKHLILCGLLITTASVWMSYTTEYGWLFFLFLMTCLGSGAFHPAAGSLAGKLTDRRKSLFITIFASGGALGLALSQVLFTQTFQLLEGRTSVLLLPSVVLAILIFSFGLRGCSQTYSDQKIDYLKIFTLYKEKNLRNLYISQVFNQAVFWGIIFLLPDILKSHGYDSWICYGGGHFCFILGGACMMIPSGYLSDKYSPKMVMLVSTLSAMVLFYAFLFLPSLPNPLLLSLIFSLGAFTGLVNPIIIAFGNRLKPDAPGMVTAFLMGMAWCIAEGLGQVSSGLLTKFFVDDAPSKALGVVGIFFVIGLASTLRLPSLRTGEGELEYIKTR